MNLPPICRGSQYIGCPIDLCEITAVNDDLNAKAVQQVNETQELVMLNNFARECNEYQYKKFAQDRVSDIASWLWVLDDLAKRLDEAVKSLQYEHNALRVVVKRVKDEINEHSRVASKPGALCPMSDVVEEAILQEYKLLCDHKKNFEGMIMDLERETKAIEKLKIRLKQDVLHKQQAISIEESCAKIDASSCKLNACRRKKKRATPVCRWESRCVALKTAGLKALSNAAIIRQQVRGARTHLSIAAQAYGARVDSAIRRRLHTNKVKLQDLKWQREEALRDYKSLDEEMLGTEQNVLETMEQERVIEARLIDRTLRPSGEQTKDEVDRKLREELGRLRNFSKQLRTNMASISSLQNHLADSMTRIDNCADDLYQIVCLDEDRIKFRLGEVPDSSCNNFNTQTPPAQIQTNNQMEQPRHTSDNGLAVIQEENEDDYPLNM